MKKGVSYKCSVTSEVKTECVMYSKAGLRDIFARFSSAHISAINLWPKASAHCILGPSCSSGSIYAQEYIHAACEK
jgi:hypothetical protein